MVGSTPKVAPDPWSLLSSGGGGGGRQLTPYQRARLQLAQQKAAQQQQASGGGSSAGPINLDAMQDAQQNNDEFGYTPDVGGSYAGIAPITSGGINNQLPTFARGGGYNPQQVANIITQKAQERGIDPAIPLAVARSEGSFRGLTGDSGSSFGPFQLHYGGIAKGGNSVGGMGDAFTAKYHEMPSPSNFDKQADFALDAAQKSGWGAWHGYHGGQWDGINRGGMQPINLDQQSANVPTPPPRPQDMGVQQPQMQQQPQVQEASADDGDSVDPTTRLSWLI